MDRSQYATAPRETGTARRKQVVSPTTYFLGSREMLQGPTAPARLGALSPETAIHIQRTAGNRALGHMLQRAAEVPGTASAHGAQRALSDDAEEVSQGEPAESESASLADIYLLGHGVHNFENGFFKLPRNTTVSFYTMHGKAMDNSDALAILRGEITSPERVIGPGESCPNMTLQPERDQQGRSAEERKAENEEHATAARSRGGDMIQVDAHENLQSIVARRGPGNYHWCCCYEYAFRAGKGQGPNLPTIPRERTGLNMGHYLGSGRMPKDSMGPAAGGVDFRRTSGSIGWDEVRRNWWPVKGPATIESAERQTSGTMTALEVRLKLMPWTKDPRNSSPENLWPHGRQWLYEYYTLLVPNEVLAAVCTQRPEFLREQREGRPLPIRLLLRTILPALPGREITMERVVVNAGEQLVMVKDPKTLSMSG